MDKIIHNTILYTVIRASSRNAIRRKIATQLRLLILSVALITKVI